MLPYIRPAVQADVPYIAARMKRPDVEEVLASNGHSPLDAMQFSFDTSEMAGTMCDADGEPVLMYGVGEYLPPDTGSPWMLSTGAIYRPHMRRFTLRQTLPAITRMHGRYPILIQYVDARHTHSLRWLMWAGFRLDELKAQWGVERIPFFRLSHIRSSHYV